MIIHFLWVKALNSNRKTFSKETSHNSDFVLANRQQCCTTAKLNIVLLEILQCVAGAMLDQTNLCLGSLS